LIKIPKNVGITRTVPNIYHGVLFPILVFVLSLRNPTIGVVKPSAIYPESMTNADITASSLTTSFTKNKT